MTNSFVQAYGTWQAAVQAKQTADVGDRHRTQDGYDRWEKAMREEASTRRAFHDAAVRLARSLSAATPQQSAGQ